MVPGEVSGLKNGEDVMAGVLDVVICTYIEVSVVSLFMNNNRWVIFENVSENWDC